MKLSLALIFLLFIACEKDKTSDDKVVADITFNSINEDVVEELNDNFTESEESFEDDMSNDLALFDGPGKAKKDDSHSYDTLTGYWSRSFDWNHSGMDSTVLGNITRVRTFEDMGNVSTQIRFADDADNSIQFPHLDPQSVVTINVMREISREIFAEIVIYLGDQEVERHSARHRDAETNSSSTLTRLDSISWNVNASADRTVFFTINRNDSILEFDRNMNVTFENVIVRKVNRRHGRLDRRGTRRAIVSGKIIHIINFANDNVLKIETEFFNCFEGQETKR
ncbi:MAG: hypothetical protein KDD94_11710, partial [Calditrichaeota bacterium]|nr:hypothetical protein [Calditrichota bacterium]